MKSVQSKEKRKTLQQKAMVIYLQCKSRFENGELGPFISFRQHTIRELSSGLACSPISVPQYYNQCRKSETTKQLKDSEPAYDETASVAPVDADRKPELILSSKVLARPAPLNCELSLVPLDAYETTKAPREISTLAIQATVTQKTKHAHDEAFAKATKTHADLLDYCTSEISDAIDTLQELVDNIATDADASALKRFVRSIRSTCIRIDSQLSTKVYIDKRQKNKILPGLQSAAHH